MGITINRSAWQGAAVIATLSVLLSCVEVMQIYLGGAALGHEPRWAAIAVSVVPSWIIFAMLIPGVLYLARRFPFERGHWRTSMAAHLVGGLVFTIVHLGGTAFVYAPFSGAESIFFRFSAIMAKYFVLDLLTYWGAVFVSYAIYYRRAAEARAVTAAQLETRLAEARLQALRSQLDPHFLFNTLNVVSALASRGKRDEVVEVVNRLSELLRRALDDRAVQEVSLRKELEFVRLYLDIQQIRFADRLKVETEVSPEALNAMVPVMLLQPLVENAVVHGLSKTPGPGSVMIRSVREAGRLRVEIGDTGPGFPDASSTELARGIGLANTRARLMQLFGKDHTFDCGVSPGGGALVTVGIPFRSTTTPQPVAAG